MRQKGGGAKSTSEGHAEGARDDLPLLAKMARTAWEMMHGHPNSTHAMHKHHGSVTKPHAKSQKPPRFPEPKLAHPRPRNELPLRSSRKPLNPKPQTNPYTLEPQIQIRRPEPHELARPSAALGIMVLQHGDHVLHPKLVTKRQVLGFLPRPTTSGAGEGGKLLL